MPSDTIGINSYPFVERAVFSRTEDTQISVIIPLNRLLETRLMLPDVFPVLAT